MSAHPSGATQPLIDIRLACGAPSGDTVLGFVEVTTHRPNCMLEIL
jgi:hypothetical protein